MIFVVIIFFVKITIMLIKLWRDFAVDLMGLFLIGESFFVIVDYYSRWIEVDVVRSIISSVIIRCLENYFIRYGILEILRIDNGVNLVSREMEEFFNELGIKYKKIILLWSRANGEVER